MMKYVFEPCWRVAVRAELATMGRTTANEEEMLATIRRRQEADTEEAIGVMLQLVTGESWEIREGVYQFALQSCLNGVQRKNLSRTPQPLLTIRPVADTQWDEKRCTKLSKERQALDVEYDEIVSLGLAAAEDIYFFPSRAEQARAQLKRLAQREQHINNRKIYLDTLLRKWCK